MVYVVGGGQFWLAVQRQVETTPRRDRAHKPPCRDEINRSRANGGRNTLANLSEPPMGCALGGSLALDTIHALHRQPTRPPLPPTWRGIGRCAARRESEMSSMAPNVFKLNFRKMLCVQEAETVTSARGPPITCLGNTSNDTACGELNEPSHVRASSVDAVFCTKNSEKTVVPRKI